MLGARIARVVNRAGEARAHRRAAGPPEKALASLALSIARAKPALIGVLLARLKRLAISEAADEPSRGA